MRATRRRSKGLLAGLREQHDARGLTVEVRGELQGLPVSGKSFYHHEVPLGPDYEAVAARFRQNAKRDIKRAAREGIEVHRGTGRAELDAFYELHLRTRQRQGVPTQPRRFIRRFERLFEHGLGFVLVATAEGTPAAAAVYLTCGQTLTYKYGASSVQFLKRRPNHAVFAESIRWGCANGMTTLDLGRTDLDNDGLRAFKVGWGGEERVLAYSSLSTKAKSSGGGIPSVAHALICRTPPIAGRLAGLALYRHFG